MCGSTFGAHTHGGRQGCGLTPPWAAPYRGEADPSSGASCDACGRVRRPPPHVDASCVGVRWRPAESRPASSITALPTGSPVPHAWPGPPGRHFGSEPTDDQAHFPAEQPPAGQDPRLPPAHAHPRRSRHPRGATPQGPHRAFGLSFAEAATVLPRSARLRRSQDFSETVRRGARAGRPLLVVHLSRSPDLGSAASDSRPGPDPRAGFVVSKAVGGSVVRHAVARRLRHVIRPRLAALPAGTMVVVRALPGSAEASSVALGVDLDAALERALRRSRQDAPAAVGL